MSRCNKTMSVASHSMMAVGEDCDVSCGLLHFFVLEILSFYMYTKGFPKLHEGMQSHVIKGAESR